MAHSLLTPKVLCFDIYGTIIDWESGIYEAAKPLLSRLPEHPSKAEFLHTYASFEAPQQTATPGLRYSELLAKVYLQLADHYKLQVSTEDADAFGASITHWPAFADSADALKRLKKHYKLVVLSNVDRKSFLTSLPKLGGDGTFDLVVTAEDVGSYKPSLKNFEYMLREVKEKLGFEKDAVCSTAQSLFHDHVPAKKIGLLGSWIDREGAVMGVGDVEGGTYEWRFRTLGEMAEAVEKEAAH